MIGKYKLVACLPIPCQQYILSNSYGRITETDSDRCLNADRRFALLHRDHNWTAISKYQETWGKIKNRAYLWAVTKIFIESEFGKCERQNQFTVLLQLWHKCTTTGV